MREDEGPRSRRRFWAAPAAVLPALLLVGVLASHQGPPPTTGQDLSVLEITVDAPR